MEKIDIAELLKDCPKGMELDCTMYEDVYFDCIDQEYGFIKCYIQNNDYKTSISFTEYGYYTSIEKSKCVIFPKGKTTWEGFQRPFKDGDIIFVKSKKSGVGLISIYKNESSHLFYDHCSVSLDTGTFYLDKTQGLIHKNDISISRLATEEEKQKLFDAIKANGYKWNPETKTLEKLIISKFKVGDRIVKRNSISNPWIVSSVSSEYYGLKLSKGSENIGVLCVSEQDDYELVPNKFNISTLKPFEKVLRRDSNDDYWNIGFFSFKGDKHFCTERGYYSQCIPFEGNEHLLGTTDDCDNYYKTWE